MQTLTLAQAQQTMAAALAHSGTAGFRPKGVDGVASAGLVAS